MVFLVSLVVDRGNASHPPVFRFHGVDLLRAHEGEPFFQIGESGSVRGNCVQPVAHWRVAGAVADQDEMEETCGVVDEVWYNAPTQVILAQVLVRKHKIRGPSRIPLQGSVNMEHASKLLVCRGSRNRSQCIGLHWRTKPLGRSFEQKIEVGGHDRCGAATVG